MALPRLILSVLLLGFFAQCKRESTFVENCGVPDGLDLFDELWTVFDREYAAFDISGKDWDAIRDKYRPLVDTNTSEETLFMVFKSMLFELEDAHADLHRDSDFGSIQYYYEVVNNTSANYIGWDALKENYLESVTELSDRLAYSIVSGTKIGYIRLANLSGESSKFDLVKKLIDRFGELDGLVIDVRNNSGGNEVNGYPIAGRIAEGRTTYRYAKLKSGCERNRLSDLKTLQFNSLGPEKFLGEVVLLTNKHTFSAGEDFTLMMKALPNVTHVGGDTWGGYATGPGSKALSNGWRYRVSKKISYDLSKKPIKGGITPNIRVEISSEDELNQKDTILEKALELLSKN